MILAISSKGSTPDSGVDPRFGRCGHFLLYDEGSKEYKTLDNIAQFASGGAGVQTAENLVNSGVGVVLTGNVGPKAFHVLDTGGIQVVTGVRGTVNEMVSRYISGEITASRPD